MFAKKNMAKHFISFILVLTISFPVFSQEDTLKNVKNSYNIIKSSTQIKIDGIANLNEWSSNTIIDQLYNHNPTDSGFAKNKTEVRLTYDDEMLYILVKCYDEGERIVQSLQRDSDNAHWDSDSFTIALDPINEKQSGYIFGVNAGGAELEGSLLIEGSRTSYSETWDERWFSSVKQYDDHWLAEIGIPFTSLRYNKDNLEWGINFIRGDKNENYYYTWTQFPVNFNGIDVNYLGTLHWKEIPDVKRKTIFIKPYSTLSSFKDNLADNKSTVTNIDAGLDVKVGITKSLNADITFNPDFSNADVDQEITNITRFDISLPERREFFVENSDIFSNFGSYEVKPFFSRRIGIKDGENLPIVYGARVTGNITDNMRLGIMNVQTKSEGEADAQNYTVTAFNQKVFKRSQLKGLFINRQETGNDNINDYNRNYGAEFTYISEKGNFNNNIKFHTTITDEGEKGNFYGIGGNYINRRLGTGWTLENIDKTYNAELGFVPRQNNFDALTNKTIKSGYFFVNPWVYYRFFPKKKDHILIRHRVRTWHNMYFNSNGDLNDRDNNFAYDFDFRNTSALTIWASNREVNLQFPTQFLGDEFTPLPVQNYNFWKGTIYYNSDVRKKFNFSTEISYGDFYNGKIVSLSATGKMRFGHWGSFNINYVYNKIDLPENYGKTDINLLKFNGLLSFTNKLFFNNTVQYNSQSTNFSMFSRLQWRYSPLSDIFLIYNQNNETNGFNLRNRSIILKVTYRFGV